MAFDFTYYAPTKVVFGRSAVDKLGGLVAAQNCKKVLVHYGGRSAKASGLLDRVTESLKAAGLEFVTLGGVVPNPRLSLVHEGIELCRREQVDFILAVGGGSVIDSSKAIAYGTAEDGEVWELFEKKRKPGACLPVGVVLTIAAAGSEMSNSCVISNQDTGVKASVANDMSRPKFAVMDPEITTSLPPWQTASGCVDIMMHTLERYFTNGGNMELTDEIAEGLLRTVMRNARILVKDPDNYEARAEIMWAGSLSHNGLTGCGNDGGDFCCHTIEHQLSAKYDVTHGAGLAAIWCSWARYVYKDCLPRFVKFALNVTKVEPGAGDEETALKGIDEMENFFREIDMPVSISGLLGRDVTDEELEELGAMAARACGGHRGSAKVLYQEDMTKIYYMAR